MKQTIAVFSGTPGTSPVFSLQSLAAGFKKLGYKTVCLDTEDNAIKDKIATLVAEEDVFFFLSHNLKGWDIRLGTTDKDLFFYDYLDKWLVTIIDTPLNKIEWIRQSGLKKILLLADESFIPLVEKIASPKTVSAPFLAYVADDYGAGDDRKVKDVADRKIDILWMGRVGANTAFMKRRREVIKRIVTHNVLRQALYSQDKQIHDIFMDLRNKSWFLRNVAPFTEPYSAESLYFVWGLSNLVRTRRRMSILKELASLPTSVRLVVVSNEPEALRGKFKSNAELLPFQEWPKAVELMGDAKIVINVQPFHIYSAHERLITAMAHGSVVATDKNPYLEERFRDGEDLIFYEFTKGHLRQKLTEYLGDMDRLRTVAMQGMQKVLEKDLAIKRAEDIIALVNRVSVERESS